jgi:hypothetical protein
MVDVEEREVRVRLIDVKDGPIRVRADSMRQTVIVDVEKFSGRVETFVLPKSFDVLNSLGIALAHVARVSSNWEDNAASGNR